MMTEDDLTKIVKALSEVADDIYRGIFDDSNNVALMRKYRNRARYERRYKRRGELKKKGSVR